MSRWSITSVASRALAIAVWGVLATVTRPRWALAAGALLLATPLLPKAETDATDHATQHPAPVRD